MDSLSTTMAALSDATRRAILVRLKTGPASVHELAQPFQMSQQAISKHLATLERAGLIEKRRDGRQHVCQLNPAPMREVATWVEQYRQHWEHAFDRLDDLLHALHPPKKGSSKP
ncbi:ArsR/SmtB family transcription factor [Sorangium sp. So ce1000]|uniref:ArsR/SmtB family transcription factor n=1 Tax=Sorangium sp. So ce1000 TaxID=3133325 RepID=UPI003F623F27